MPEIGLWMSRKWHERVLSIMGEKWDNSNMEQLLKTLSEIGLPDDEVRRIGECYRNDLDGLTHYVMYMRAMLDDRHEYLD